MESQPAPKPQPFPEIPGYRIEAVIGRGSAGIVYRALQLAIERKVALKVLHPELASRGRAVRRLQREARTTARLSHPGIVSAIDMGTTNGLWWYAMELVDGPSLAERLKKSGVLSEREALRLFIPLCEALEHAFEHGVVHRDIKPANIFMVGRERARVLDFGIARMAQQHDLPLEQEVSGGSPYYMAPEQILEQPVDARSDVYALGVVLYELLAGRRAFAGRTLAEIQRAVLERPPPLASDVAPAVPPALARIAARAMAIDPDRRHPSAAALARELRQWQSARAVPAAGPTAARASCRKSALNCSRSSADSATLTVLMATRRASVGSCAA